ncbi:MAG: nucleotidyltransferase family protein [Spirochaetes bacterium]|nr:nucleotidyltransferase family protein [Spirochaetota bacterium]
MFMTLTKEKIINNPEIINICKKENISYLALFGSYKNGSATENSDIDLLIKLKGSQSLFRLIKISQELSELLNKKVDLLTENAISPYIKENILNDLEVIYNEE